MKKKIAIICMGKTWFGIARIFPEIASHGYEIHCIAGIDTLAAKSKYITHRHLVNKSTNDIEWLETLLSESFDLLLPGDDFAVDWLLEAGESSTELAELVKKSMGSYESLAIARNKYRLAQLAKSLQIPVAKETLITESVDNGALISQLGWPLIIKGSRGFAGIDVKICNNLRQLKNALKSMQGKENVFAQKFIQGTPLMVPVACHEGEIIQCFSAYKDLCWPPIVGPSILVNIEACATALEYAQRLVGKLELSGLISFDFVVDSHGESWLMECNLRPVPVSHLNGLVSAWLLKKKPQRFHNHNRKLALFPQSKLSGYRHEFKDYKLDMLNDDPPLLEAMNREIAEHIKLE